MKERLKKQHSEDQAVDISDTDVSQSLASNKLRDELDDLLDEIDEALETNAEEFVKNYVQKGGE